MLVASTSTLADTDVYHTYAFISDFKFEER